MSASTYEGVASELLRRAGHALTSGGGEVLANAALDLGTPASVTNRLLESTHATAAVLRRYPTMQRVISPNPAYYGGVFINNIFDESGRYAPPGTGSRHVEFLTEKPQRGPEYQYPAQYESARPATVPVARPANDYQRLSPLAQQAAPPGSLWSSLPADAGELPPPPAPVRTKVLQVPMRTVAPITALVEEIPKKKARKRKVYRRAI